VGCARITRREGSFIGDPEGYIKKALETGVFPYGGPVGGPWKGRCFAVEFERKLRFLFIRGLVYWGIREICKKKKLWRRATLSIGAPLWNLQQGSLTGGLERQ
jgi:hypothetical protein